MNKNLREIIKIVNILKKQHFQNKRIVVLTEQMSIVLKGILKAKRAASKKEMDHLEIKLVVLMQGLYGKASHDEFAMLLECLELLVEQKSMDKITKATSGFKYPPIVLDDEVVKKKVAKKKRIDYKNIESLEKNLKQKIYSQDRAIEELVSVIKISAAGLAEENKPIASFLFTGPTGVGKTELAKQLASELDIAFVRFDMSEYSAEHTAAKLTGSPAGYIGYDAGGLLTNAILKNNCAVLLLDEIEKADPSVMTVFLQMMDNAEVTDNKGKKVSFKDVIVIMTSNLGTKVAKNVGFVNKSISFSNDVGTFLAPEFINRLDGVLQFEHLKREVSLNIVDKLLQEVQVSLTGKKVTIEVSASAKGRLAALGYSNEMGAREMKRTVNQHIKRPLSNEVLYGKLSAGGIAYVDAIDEELVFKYEERSVQDNNQQ